MSKFAKIMLATWLLMIVNIVLFAGVICFTEPTQFSSIERCVNSAN